MDCRLFSKRGDSHVGGWIRSMIWGVMPCVRQKPARQAAIRTGVRAMGPPGTFGPPGSSVGAVFVATVVAALVAGCTPATTSRPANGTTSPTTATISATATTPTSAPRTTTPTSAPPTTAPTTTPRKVPPVIASRRIWRPRPGTTWQWQITGAVNLNVTPAAMFDIDLEDALPAARTIAVAGFGRVTWPKGDNAGVIPRLHARGRVVICYLDSGAWESYRPDAALFPASVRGGSTGWSGERWLDIRPEAWRKFAPLIWARMNLARAIGCDGIEPDQNNPMGNNPGFPITFANQRAWYLEVARQAHARRLSVGMKNGIESIDARTVAAFDWALNEECFQYSECEALRPFIAARKAVFQVEYEGNPAVFCPSARSLRFSSMKKRLELDAWRIVC